MDGVDLEDAAVVEALNVAASGVRTYRSGYA
jgi:hypothetical protein